MPRKADCKDINRSRKAICGAILSLSVPAIVTNVTVPVLGITDVAIAGHLGSPAYIAAVAVGTSMFNLLYWLFNFLRMGSSGLTAQAYGAGDRDAASVVLGRAVTIALMSGLVMILLRHPICSLLLDSMKVEGTARQLAQSYFMIRIWAAPATLSIFAFTGWFVGMQNSRITMWISLLVDVVNIAGSIAFVYGCNLNINGLALGTAIAQWVGLTAAVVFAARKYKVKLPSLTAVFEWSGLRRFFSINLDIFLRTLCLIIVTLWFTRIGASQGDTMLAVNSLIMQLFTIFSFFMDGFAFAGEGLSGKYKGACDRIGFRQTVKYLLWFGVAISAVFTTLYALCGELFIGFLTDDVEVAAASRDYIYWAATIPFAGFLAFTWDGIFIGTTETRSMLVSMLMAMGVFFGVFYMSFSRFGNHGLWLAFISYLVVRGVALWILSRRFNRDSYFCSAR
ncbi:MAG: MATE family efflux transporter [Paramuribaculum sp.]|nr:MATE family efflux transporter [Paramuribaculum sp.]